MKLRRGSGGTSLMFCIFSASRWAPVRRCQCPNCIRRREYKKLKQRIYQARHPEWRVREREIKRYTDRKSKPVEWRAMLMYAHLRNLMIEDNAWPLRNGR